MKVTPDSIVMWLSWFHNQYPFIGILLIMMMIDVITGVIAAFIGKNLNSSTSWNGMGRKVIMLMAVGMGTALEPYSGSLPLGRLIAVFYTFTEGISIMENMARSGVPVPAQLRDALEKYGSSQRGSAAVAANQSVTINRATNVDIHHADGSESKPSDSVVITASELPKSQ